MIEWVIPGRLARSPRPHAAGKIDAEAVEAWLGEAHTKGIRSILCLLDEGQLARYDHLPGGLLGAYGDAGFAAAHLPIDDLQEPPIPAERLAAIWRVFLDLPSPMVVHCWAGVDRTGAAVGYLRDRLAQEGGA